MHIEHLIVLRLALGVVFMWAAVGKLLHPARFAAGLGAYAALPTPALAALAAILILLELFLGVSHLSGWLLREGIILALATLILFAAVVRWRLSDGRTGPCLCFNVDDDSEQISQRTIARLGLLIAGEILLIANIGSWSGASEPNRVFNPQTSDTFIMMAVWTIILLMLGAWFLRLTDVLELINNKSS